MMKVIQLLILIFIVSCNSKTTAPIASIEKVESQEQLVKKESLRQQGILDRSVEETKKDFNPILVCKEEGRDIRYILSDRGDGTIKVLTYDDSRETNKVTVLNHVCRSGHADISSAPRDFILNASTDLGSSSGTYLSDKYDCRFGKVTDSETGNDVGYLGFREFWSVDLNDAQTSGIIYNVNELYQVVNGEEEEGSRNVSFRNLSSCSKI